ncbi:MAG: hypothetical protein ACREBG_18785 [Pyrinomonadaceae bacterium]
MRLSLLVFAFASFLVLGACKRSDTSQSPGAAQTSAQQPAAAPSMSPAASVGQQVITSNTGPSPSSNVTEVKPKTDACALLTSKEIESIQGEPLKETKLSGRSEGGFLVSQCFFTLPTFTNSISLAVTQKAEGSGSRDPKEFWHDTFASASNEKEREREREKGRGEEEEKTPPKKISGVGDEAFWMGSRVGGALYVLKGNSYVRVSVGGSGDEASKIKKSRALAQKALARI